MAAVKTLFGKCQIFRQKVPALSAFIQQNEMSQYPSYYIEPIYKKEIQQELTKSGEIVNYQHLPTKAAFNDQTCSAAHDQLVSLFINYAMQDGQKALARQLIEESFEKVKRMQLEKYHKCKTEEEKANIELNPRVVFYRAVENCKPLLQLLGIKRGGVKYQVPVPLADRKSQFISMKWLIAAAKEKDRKVRFTEQMARELVDAANNTGRVVRKKQELHRQCEANKAYAHYRWS